MTIVIRNLLTALLAATCTSCADPRPKALEQDSPDDSVRLADVPDVPYVPYATTIAAANLMTSSGILEKLDKLPSVVAPKISGIGGVDQANIESVTGESITWDDAADGAQAGQSKSFRYQLERSRHRLFVMNSTRTFTDRTDTGRVDEGAIQDKAVALLRKLGIAAAHETEISVHRLMARDNEGGGSVERELAFKAYVHLRVADQVVRGPKITVSYFLDGVLHKLKVSWPYIPSGDLRPSLARDYIAERISEELVPHPLAAVEGLQAEAALVVRGGRLRRAIVIQGDLLEAESEQARVGVIEVLL